MRKRKIFALVVWCIIIAWGLVACANFVFRSTIYIKREKAKKEKCDTLHKAPEHFPDVLNR